MQQLETKLSELFTTKAPVQLPESAKKTLVQFVPWVTLIGGVISVFALFGVYQLIMLGTGIVNYANSINAAYGYAPAVNPLYTTGLWVSLVVLAVEAVLFLVAFSPLKARRYKGWNLLFYIAIANFVYALLYLMVDMNIGTLIFSWIGSIVGLYFLFQIRSYYLGDAKTTQGSSKKTTSTTTTPPTAK